MRISSFSHVQVFKCTATDERPANIYRPGMGERTRNLENHVTQNLSQYCLAETGNKTCLAETGND